MTELPEAGPPLPKRARRTAHATPSTPTGPLPADVTPEMLARIHYGGAKNRSRDAEDASVCHQCRQFSADTKTICRSGRCSGFQGSICGTCLPTRYGQQVQDALLDPKWACPVCRGVCNCSLCRNKHGLPPTGRVYKLALSLGYTNVHDYLIGEEGSKEQQGAPAADVKA